MSSNTETTKELTVDTCSVSELFNLNQDITVVIPDFQRPYVWGEEKIEQLLQDLEYHFSNAQENLPYYLGTVLFHCKDKKFQIIDGQQRITTLLIIDHLFNGETQKQDKWNLKYCSSISEKKIKENYKYLKTKSSLFQKDGSGVNAIFKKLIISVIVTTSEDEAFTFFDSQNSRGVSLSAVDFLKSYHLRDLNQHQDAQRVFAKKWDSNNKEQFLDYLFRMILWRNRNWKGKKLYFENKDEILKSFQKQTIDSNGHGIDLYPNAFNALSNKLNFQPNSGISLQPNTLNLQAKPEQFPFAIRQPIQKGIGFFLYAEKYYALYQILFEEERFEDFSNAYNTLYDGVSHYFRQFFKLASISFYDKFKEERLLEFALWLDYLLGSIRIKQSSIVAQTVIKTLRDEHQNLLDVIEMSYRPEEVFEFLKRITDPDDYEKGITQKGVRKKYLDNNLEYFKIQDNNPSLINKKDWINAVIDPERNK